jgi:hypothetical protein
MDHSEKERSKVRTYISQEMSPKCNQFAFLLRSFNRGFSIIAPSADEWFRSPNITNEIVGIPGGIVGVTGGIVTGEAWFDDVEVEEVWV